MKKLTIPLAGLLLSTTAFSAQVVSGAVTLTPDFLPFGSGPSYALRVDQTIDGDYVVAWLAKSDIASKRQSTIASVTYTVDEGMDLYIARPDAPLNKENIAAGVFTPLLVAGRLYSVTIPLPSTFYLGINTGTGFSGVDFTPGRQVFGWAKLQNTLTGLTLLGSAMAYDATGIYIGTTSAVPEPAAIWLAALGVAGLALGRRAHRCQAH